MGRDEEGCFDMVLCECADLKWYVSMLTN
jgi:hypothetical protein